MISMAESAETTLPWYREVSPKAWRAFIAALTFFSAGAGSWLYGMLADRIGRKKTLMISLLTYSIATGL